MSTIQFLDSVSDIDVLIQASQQGPVLLYKHSLACPISARAQEEFIHMTGAPRYALAVQYVRDVSQAVAERLNVSHASPQLLVVEKGEVTLNLTHDAVQADTVRARLESPRL